MHTHIPLTAVHPQGDFVLLYANEFVAFSGIFYNIYGSVNCSHPIALSTPKFLKKRKLYRGFGARSFSSAQIRVQCVIQVFVAALSLSISLFNSIKLIDSISVS